VQSPALRLIVEREQEIERFKTEEYWTLEANCQKEEWQKFTARLNLFTHKKIKLLASEIKPKEQETHLSISSEEQATTMRATLLELAQGQLQVTKVEKKQLKRQPPSPFITSTLQQEAARKLGFATKKTMQIAQQLYEGIDIGQGAVGLITYMRTDSVHLADEAVADIRETIKNRYGEDNLPKQPRQFKTTAKNAQEAHEAIRPTLASRYPEEITAHLSSDQLKLYTLIWQRTIACQMIHATLATVGVDLACGEGNNFRATGSTVLNQGFMRVYQEGIDDKKTSPEDERMLPPLTEGEWIPLKDIIPEQHFTEPPPRFSEATLVKDLEKLGIGRPSTYATIISTLQQREYVTLDKKRFTPTDVGRVVNKFLTEHFTQYVDYDFTAKLEDKLDAVSRGEQAWIPLMGEFWSKFKHLVDEKAQTVQRSDVTQEATTEICPECGQPLNIRLGKRGRFIGCSAYPKCSYTRNVEGDATGAPSTSTPTIVEDRTCPLCQSPLHIKQGPYSKFIGCSNYPKCKFTESLEKAVDTGIFCPQCHQGKLTRKKSRYGNFFYACTSYPTCKYAIAEQPLAETCPQCGWPILMLKTTKRWGTQKVCPQKTCDYHQAVPTPDPVEEKVENRD
jgi:DNA topoisomerase-1